MTEESAMFSVSRDLTVTAPKSPRYFVVDPEDWKFLKTKVSRLKEIFQLYETVGGAFLGCALSCFYEFSKNTGQHTPLQWGICLLIFAGTILWMAKQEKAHRAEFVSDILEYAKTIETKAQAQLEDTQAVEPKLQIQNQNTTP